MQNLTEYCDNELSLIVMNDEFLYNKALYDQKDLLAIIGEFFIYTTDQMQDLEETLAELDD